MRCYTLAVVIIIALGAVAEAAQQECRSCQECTALAAKSNIDISVTGKNVGVEQGDCIIISGSNVSIRCEYDPLGETIEDQLVYSKNGIVFKILKGAGDVSIRNCHTRGNSSVYAEEFGSALTISDSYLEQVGYPGATVYLNLSPDSKARIFQNRIVGGYGGWLRLLGDWVLQNVYIEENEFVYDRNLEDCGKLWGRRVVVGEEGRRVYQIATLRLREVRALNNAIGKYLTLYSYTKVKCEETARLEPEMHFKYNSKHQMFVVSLAYQSTPLPGEEVVLSLGEKKMQVTTSEDGTVLVYAGDKEIAKLINENATAAFKGNSYFSPKTVKIEFTDSSSGLECERVYGSGDSVLNVIFIPVQPRGFMPDTGGNRSPYFSSDEAFKDLVLHDLVDVEGDGRGMFSTKVFSDNRDLFGIWICKYGFNTFGDDGERTEFSKFMSSVYASPGFWKMYEGRLPDIREKLSSAGYRNSITIYVVDGVFRSTGGDRIMMSVGKITDGMIAEYARLFPGTSPHPVPPELRKDTAKVGSLIVTHELGHTFGLADEYLELLLEPRNRYGINCVGTPEEARRIWGDLVGSGEGLFKVGYFTGNPDLAQYVGAKGYEGFYYLPDRKLTSPRDYDYEKDYGCSYTTKNIRPTQQSIMNFDWTITQNEWYRGFGPVNERFLSTVFSKIRESRK